MLNVVRRSQVHGLIAIDGATVTQLDRIEEVWLDSTGKVAYFSGSAGYLPLEQVADIGTTALSMYGRLMLEEAPIHLHSLARWDVQSSRGDPLGWIEDFLFDWHTGEVAAYILTGSISQPWGEPVAVLPEEVTAMTEGHLILNEGAQDQIKPATERLSGFLSEKSKQVQHLVSVFSERLHHLILPDDRPEVVRVKVNAVRDELAHSGEHHDYQALQEAADYLHEQWETLQQGISRSGSRAKAAVDAAWKYLREKR
jgi:hypothetical protein